jgi:hypothetical protein
MPFLPLKSDLDDFFPQKKENYWNSIISWESNFAILKNVFFMESSRKWYFKELDIDYIRYKIGNKLGL